VHSPFVFDLVTKCFYDTKKHAEYPLLETYRLSLLQNRNTIKVTDFGAGSKVFKSDVREISKIAKNAGITGDNAKLLFRITKYFKPQHVLEIGTSLGLATSALSLADTASTITTLEGCPETAAAAQQQFRQFNLKAIRSIVTDFDSHLEDLSKSDNYQLIYFDGNHQKEATLRYFDLLLPTISNETVWIFDDIHWSAAMEEAWDIIKKHPSVTVTIDTFQWGIVFFRKEQEKEHFVIRT